MVAAKKTKPASGLPTTCPICLDKRLTLRVQEFRLRGRTAKRIAEKLGLSESTVQSHLDGMCLESQDETIRSSLAQFRSRVDLMLKDLDLLRGRFVDDPNSKTSYAYTDMMRTLKESLEGASKIKDPDTTAHEIRLKVLQPLVTSIAASLIASAKQMRESLPNKQRSLVDEFLERNAALLQADVEWAASALQDVLNGRAITARAR